MTGDLPAAPPRATPAAQLAQGERKIWFAHFVEDSRARRISTGLTDYGAARRWLAAFEAARALFN